MCILVCMRITLNVKEGLLERAMELTGQQQKTALINTALELLVAKKAGERLAALGGTMPHLRPVRRRRFK